MDMAEHEVANAGAAALLVPRHDVHEHELGDLLRACGVGDEDAGHSAPARPDQNHRPANLLQYLQRVGAQRIHGVGRIGGAVAVAVAAAVTLHDTETPDSPEPRLSSERTWTPSWPKLWPVFSQENRFCPPRCSRRTEGTAPSDVAAVA